MVFLHPQKWYPPPKAIRKIPHITLSSKKLEPVRQLLSDRLYRTRAYLPPGLADDGLLAVDYIEAGAEGTARHGAAHQVVDLLCGVIVDSHAVYA